MVKGELSSTSLTGSGAGGGISSASGVSCEYPPK